MRKRFKPQVTNSSEFELDLAPLLAVMVKLVPVLLVSSAFVQIMVIETELPQTVKEALAKNDDVHSAQVLVNVSKKKGIQVTVIDQQNRERSETIANSPSGEFNLNELQNSLVKVKHQHPEVFRISLRSSTDVTYKELVKVMDEARRAKDKSNQFPILDSKKNEMIETDYMFPDVVLADVMEG